MKQIRVGREEESKVTTSCTPNFKVNSECSPDITDKIVSGFTKELSEVLKRVEEVTLQGDNPCRFDASFVWISIFAEKDNPEKVRGINYRIKSSLFVKEGDGWKEIPGYQENFGFAVPERLDQSNSEFFDEICESGVVYALAKVSQTMLPD